jgi:type II secretory pathway component GspD/PulD (secretin)
VKTSLVLAALLVASSVHASVSVRRAEADAKKLDVIAVREPLSNVVNALQFYLPQRVQLVVSGDPLVSFRVREVTPDAALRLIAKSACAVVALERGQYWLRDAKRVSGVTLDVEDEDVRVILKEMQQQCGIRNLVLDKDVQGRATFLFADVPCATAFNVVLATFGLRTSDSYANSLVMVGKE